METANVFLAVMMTRIYVVKDDADSRSREAVRVVARANGKGGLSTALADPDP
jgi:hypothetical protein